MSETAGVLGVVGAGTMGAGIAQVTLEAGWTVRLHDAAPGAFKGGRRRIEDGHGRPAGAEVLVVVRPERVRMAAPGVGAGGRLAARVEDVTYVGGILRYRLRLESGETLVAVEPNLGGAGFAAGQAVEAWWEPNDASVIEGE